MFELGVLVTRMGIDHDALVDFQGALPAALGDGLLALYLDPDAGKLDKELWLLVRPETEMESVRQAFFPLWTKYPDAFRQGPAVSTLADFARYNLLFPERARHLRDRAQLLAGEEQWSRLPEPIQPDPLLQLAKIAYETMRCSSLLFSDQSPVEMEERLIRVATDQAGLEIAAGTPALEVLGALYTYLDQSETYPAYHAYHWDGAPPAEDPPSHLPNLLALVGLKYHLIIVMPRVDRPLLTGIDWTRAAELISNEFTGFLLATPWQLRLVACVELAQDLFLRSFDQVWGSDVLAACSPAEYHVMRSAAVLPVRVLMEQLPADYMTVEEGELSDLIHDVQNILLNIQLRGELMARLKGTPSCRPPEPLPGREAPHHQRVAANFRHFRWWAERWVTDWKKACADEDLTI